MKPRTPATHKRYAQPRAHRKCFQYPIFSRCLSAIVIRNRLLFCYIIHETTCINTTTITAVTAECNQSLPVIRFLLICGFPPSYFTKRLVDKHHKFSVIPYCCSNCSAISNRRCEHNFILVILHIVKVCCKR